jgi:hypothetical protein
MFVNPGSTTIWDRPVGGITPALMFMMKNSDICESLKADWPVWY